VQNFATSLAKGKVKENIIIKLFESVGFTCNSADAQHRSFWDIEARSDDISFTAEIKYDIMAKRTNNLAIEVFNPKLNKPSGIYTTCATLWIHVIGDDIYVTSCKRLRKFLQENKPHRVIKAGGDKNSDMALYQIDTILPIFYKINTLLRNELTNLLIILVLES